jgi:hypothetical protein
MIASRSSVIAHRSIAMTHDFFDPTPEERKVVLVDPATLRKAEKLIESCEHCNPEGTECEGNAARIKKRPPRSVGSLFELATTARYFLGVSYGL